MSSSPRIHPSPASAEHTSHKIRILLATLYSFLHILVSHHQWMYLAFPLQVLLITTYWTKSQVI